MKTSSLEKILLDFFVKKVKTDRKFTHGSELTKEKIKKAEEFFLKFLRNENIYKSFSVRNGIVEKLIFAFEENHPLKGKIIACPSFFISSNNPKEIMQEFVEIRKFLKNKKASIFYSVSLNNKKALQAYLNAGFKIDATMLRAKVTDSLKAVHSKSIELAEDFEIRVPQKKDFNALLNVEINAHKSDPTSVVQDTGKKFKDGFKSLFTDLTKRKLLFAVFNEKGNPIAHIGVAARAKEIAHIMFIAISPEYQGQGLSYILYERGLKKMKEVGAKEYTGFTSTKKVLRLSRKLKRKPKEYTLVCNP